MNIMEPWTNEVETLIVRHENESANYAEIICNVICWKTKKKYSGIFHVFVVACYASDESAKPSTKNPLASE